MWSTTTTMEITHIMRGDEWIATAPVHVRLYEAFGWDVPQLAHMPLILAPGGGKLSKRHGSTAMEEFRSQGYLPEALMNYLALLGWSLDGTTEIFSKEDLLENFTLERVSPSPATFDYEKLLWFNQHYINHILTVEDLVQRVVPFLVEAGLIEAGLRPTRSNPKYPLLHEATRLLKDRIKTLAEAPELMSYFLLEELPPYDPDPAGPEEDRAGAGPRRARGGCRSCSTTLDLDDLEGDRGALAGAGRAAGPQGRPALHADPRRRDRPDGIARPLRDAARDRHRARPRAASRNAIALLGE